MVNWSLASYLCLLGQVPAGDLLGRTRDPLVARALSVVVDLSRVACIEMELISFVLCIQAFDTSIAWYNSIIYNPQGVF